ncbi:hypothetical protein [Paludifilum halophilum]|uniref:Uncharacterized protein n=1 Tax=Paludifilum halophilum TaxID=1642702 RepID=A0A235B317_9BACL|nr:hypothetical protein [Paludifilum halophilum]OYD06297.1 hypothetical protein CHM34_17185 [Paludifilum halophilum]
MGKKVEGFVVYFVDGKPRHFEGEWVNDLFNEFVEDPERSDECYQTKETPRTVTVFTDDRATTLNMDNVVRIEWKYEEMTEQERTGIFL